MNQVLDSTIEQTKSCASNGAAGLFYSGSPQGVDQDTCILDDEKRQREEIGWAVKNLPSSVCWLTLDGETLSDAHFSGGISKPGSDQVERQPRVQPVNPNEWARVALSATDKERFIEACSLWYGYRKKGESNLIPGKVWRRLQRHLETDGHIWRSSPALKDAKGAPIDSAHPSFWLQFLLQTLSEDTHYLRSDQAAACGQRSLIGIYRTPDGKMNTSVSRYRCKSWTCAHCSRKMQFEKGKELAGLFESITQANLKNGNYRPIFLTLTLDPTELRRRYPNMRPHLYEALSWKLIRSQWKEFIRLMRVQFKGSDPFEYTLRIEATKRGYAHLHAVIIAPHLRVQMATLKGRKEVKEWVRSTAIRCGYGKILDIEPVRHPREIGFYLAKGSTYNDVGALAYEVTKAKQLRSAAIPRGYRTIEHSRGLWTVVGAQHNIQRYSPRGASGPMAQTEREYISIGMASQPLEVFEHLIRTEEQTTERKVRDWARPAVSDEHKVIEYLARHYIGDDSPPI